MSPPAKKIKVEPEKESILFTTPGEAPDVRLRVFSKEFHVCGVVLKTHSAFFRAKLEPVGDAKPPPRTTNLFSSEFFTKLEVNGDWVLSSEPADRYANISGFKGDKTREENAFQKLLCAMFGRRYEIIEIDELKTITDLAEYYRALPILSTSLDGTFYRNTGFHTRISEQPCTVLVMAKKLRHQELFRDAFIYSLGPWNNPRHQALRDIDKLKDELLWNLTQLAHQRMGRKLLDIQRATFQYFARRSVSGKKGRNQDGGRQMVDIAFECVDTRGRVMYPTYFRKCLEILEEEGDEGKLKELLTGALKNNLVLDKSGEVVGEGEFGDFFLCHQVPPFPWNTADVDW